VARTTGRFDDVIVIGMGAVVQDRVRPALHALAREWLVHRVTYADRRDGPRFDPDGVGLVPGGEHFVPVGPAHDLPLAALRRRGGVGPRALAVVCAPPEWHVPYAERLAPLVGRVAVEKPLSDRPDAARRLLDGDPGQVFPLGRQLFEEEMLAFHADCMAGRIDPEAVGRVEFARVERPGTNGRQLDEAILDLGWHGPEALLALPWGLWGQFEVELEDLRIATYVPLEDEPPRPAAATAARIRGKLAGHRRDVAFDLRVGQGLAREHTHLILFDRVGRPLRRVDLREGGWRADDRMLKEVVTRPAPDPKLSLPEAVAVVELCHRAVGMARAEGDYPFGTTPLFLGTEPDPAENRECVPTRAGAGSG
jgi:hypothetical protein